MKEKRGEHRVAEGRVSDLELWSCEGEEWGWMWDGEAQLRVIFADGLPAALRVQKVEPNGSTGKGHVLETGYTG